MSFPGIFRRLFQKEGAGPLLRKEIIPPHADTHTADGGDPLDLAALGVNRLYDLGNGERILYVRPDGNDENDGLVDSPERAWASIDHAVEWINSHRFTGAGWITLKIADGTYTATGKRSPLACNGAQFAESMATFPDGPVDPTNPQMFGSSRIVLVGNVANPSAVRYVIPSSLPLLTFVVSGCGVYGLTLSIQPGASSQIRGAIVSSSDAAAGYMANCILEAGPDTGVAHSPYTAIRGRGRLTMYGNITIRSTSTWNPYFLWWPEDGAFYNFGHYTANMAGSGSLYVESPLKCTVESSVMGLQKAYYAYTTGAPTTGFVRVAGSTISIANLPEYRYEITMPNVFQSYGAGGNFFPGKNAGIGSVPSSLYL